MGEAKRERESVIAEFGESGLWKVTDGAERVLRKERLRELHLQELIAGLARCPVCKREAKLVVFGRRGKGVWIGCDRTDECARYIEYHSEGWSIDEVAECWNHRNRGLNWLIRKVKMWFRGMFDEKKRAERAEKREAEERDLEEKEERLKRFGAKLVKRGYFERKKEKVINFINKVFRKKGKKPW